MKNIILLSIIFFALISAQETGAKYLIITHDNFYDAILPYAQWKHKMGLRTKIVRVPSELAQSSTAIRNYIVNAYNTWQIKPEFILFVGAPNYIPWSFSSYPYGDNNYTNMDYDIYNEILSGRLTVHNITEAQTVVAKMLKYERYPDISDSLWFKKGCLIVRDIQDDDSATYRLDAQYVAGLMINNGYVKVDTFFATKGDNATSVVNATNNGRGFVLYRGAATNNWYSPFAVNPDNLTNGNKLPIVISATCGTLGTGSTSATAERWFLTGAPTTLRGAAGYFATTTSITNGAYLRSAVTRGFFDGVFLYKRRTFGEACEDGRLRVYNMYSSTNEYRGFTTIGDPAMTIWTSLPKKITVVYDSILYAGTEETLQINVQYQGTPVESAYVCIMSDSSIYKTGWTNTSGSIIFNFNSPDTGMLYITVTGRNIYPFEGISSIIYNNVYLVYDGDTISDSLNNGNGIVDPGEIILLWIKIKNCGASLAQGVKAILKTTDTMVVVSDTISYYGNIESGQTSSGLNPFVFTVSQKTPAHLIPFTVTMSDQNDSTWVTNFTIPTTGTIPGGNGTGPDPYGYYIYDDTDTTTGHAPTYDWFEIASSSGGPGTIIPEITDADDDTVTFALPFNFPFYGVDYNTIGICSNGFLELSTSTYPYGDNTQIPRVSGPRRLIAPFWDDFDLRPPPDGNGDVYYYSDTTNHRFIVEYKDCRHYGIIPLVETFQVILFDPGHYPTPTGDGEILINYCGVDNPYSCTVGIEDETETRGLQYVYNNNYDPDASPIVNSRALLITTKPPISH
ncbi:MAG: C25 family cysteine peptidase, partial [bacterium]